MTNEAEELLEKFGSKLAATVHLIECISLLKTVMSGCSSTSERYEITNLIKHYKEIKKHIDKT